MPSRADVDLKDFVTTYAKRNPDAVLNACEKLCIETVAELMSLRLRTGLVELGEDLFPAGEAMLLESALDDKAADTKSVIESADSMDGILTNLGIVAALVATVSAGVFTGIAADEWQTYKDIQAPTWSACQPFASAQNSSAYLYVEGSAYTSMDECAEHMTELQERWFVQSNTIAFTLLTFVVLMTSWLYIVIHSSHAMLTRPEELRIVVGIMRPFFGCLQFVFLAGVIVAGFGISLFIQTKIRGMELARWVSMMTGLLGAVLGAGGILSILSWRHINRQVDRQRAMTATTLSLRKSKARTSLQTAVEKVSQVTPINPDDE